MNRSSATEGSERLTLDCLRGLADDYCNGEELQRVLLEQVLERFIALADEQLTARSESAAMQRLKNLLSAWALTDDEVVNMVEEMLKAPAQISARPEPKVIKDFPGRAVEQFRAEHQGRLPQEVEMKVPPAPLTERLALAAQACRAAGLLSCEASVREAMTALSATATTEGTAALQLLADIADAMNLSLAESHSVEKIRPRILAAVSSPEKDFPSRWVMRHEHDGSEYETQCEYTKSELEDYFQAKAVRRLDSSNQGAKT